VTFPFIRCNETQFSIKHAKNANIPSSATNVSRNLHLQQQLAMRQLRNISSSNIIVATAATQMQQLPAQ